MRWPQKLQSYQSPPTRRGARKLARHKHKRRMLRACLAEAQGWRCCYCPAIVELPPAGRTCSRQRMATFEHVQKREHGGRSTWENLVIACARCNSKRGDLAPLEFFAYVQEQLRTGAWVRL